MRARIKAISYYLPEQKLTNADLCKIFPALSEKEIFAKTGINIRHISATGEIASDIAFQSGRLFFEEQFIKKEEIDFLIFISDALDYKGPTTACILQERLNLPKQCGSIDILHGCSGFIYGLSMAKGLVESGQAENVLVLTADMPTKVLHPDDHELRMIFSDGGAATLVSASGENNNSAIGNFIFGTDGSGAKKLMVHFSGAREPMSLKWLEKYKNAGGMEHGKMEMDGAEIFIFALKIVPQMVTELLKKSGLSANDIDLFVLHQANGYLLEVLRKKMKIPNEKFFVYLENVGNTVSASIPIALKEAIKEGKAKKGDKILLAGFGIGFSWAGTIINL